LAATVNGRVQKNAVFSGGFRTRRQKSPQFCREIRVSGLSNLRKTSCNMLPQQQVGKANDSREQTSISSVNAGSAYQLHHDEVAGIDTIFGHLSLGKF
jgi:hypothetical protein